MIRPYLIAVPNISEGRRPDLVRQIGGTGAVLDIHIDPDHNRSVITLGATLDDLVAACIGLVDRAMALLDIREHDGVHPRFGVVDVLPFVPYEADETMAERAVDALAEHAHRIRLPYFRYYGARLSLPELRNQLRSEKHDSHPSAGVLCIGVRGPLIAFNVNLRAPLSVARTIAARTRSLPAVRALGFALHRQGLTQVSMNLVDPSITGPREAFAFVARHDVEIVDAEIVGLVPDTTDMKGVPLRSPARTITEAIADKRT